MEHSQRGIIADCYVALARHEKATRVLQQNFCRTQCLWRERRKAHDQVCIEIFVYQGGNMEVRYACLVRVEGDRAPRSDG